MSWELLGREVGESEVADFLAGLRVFQESQDFGLGELGQVFRGPRAKSRLCGGLNGSRPCLVSEVRKCFEGRGARRHPFGAEPLQRQRVPGDVEELVVTFLAPILKRILVK